VSRERPVLENEREVEFEEGGKEGGREGGNKEKGKAHTYRALAVSALLSDPLAGAVTLVAHHLGLHDPEGCSLNLGREGRREEGRDGRRGG